MIEKTRRIIGGRIRRELSKGTHTLTMCECGRRGCRSGRCWECLLEQLESGFVNCVEKEQ